MLRSTLFIVAAAVQTSFKDVGAATTHVAAAPDVMNVGTMIISGPAVQN